MVRTQYLCIWSPSPSPPSSLSNKKNLKYLQSRSPGIKLIKLLIPPRQLWGERNTFLEAAFLSFLKAEMKGCETLRAWTPLKQAAAEHAGGGRVIRQLPAEEPTATHWIPTRVIPISRTWPGQEQNGTKGWNGQFTHAELAFPHFLAALMRLHHFGLQGLNSQVPAGDWGDPRERPLTFPPGNFLTQAFAARCYRGGSQARIPIKRLKTLLFFNSLSLFCKYPPQKTRSSWFSHADSNEMKYCY